MCRFVLYLGPALRLSALLTEPRHSLIRQSTHSRERREPLNGDGFGVVWYVQRGTPQPARYRTVAPAWSDENLVDLASSVESSCILAHVRAATRGRSAGQANCHPFRAGRWSFMHNGDLGSFLGVRRRLLAELSDSSFAVIEGQTDSEHAFAVFLERLLPLGEAPSTAAVADALRTTVDYLLGLARDHGAGVPSYLNFGVSDGERAFATRVSTEPGHDGETLYLNQGRRYLCEDGVCRMAPGDEATVIVSSEPLSEEPGWEMIPPNSIVSIDRDRSVLVEPL